MYDEHEANSFDLGEALEATVDNIVWFTERPTTGCFRKGEQPIREVDNRVGAPLGPSVHLELETAFLFDSNSLNALDLLKAGSIGKMLAERVTGHAAVTDSHVLIHGIIYSDILNNIHKLRCAVNHRLSYTRYDGHITTDARWGAFRAFTNILERIAAKPRSEA